MPFFHYQVENETGKRSGGMIEAESETIARAELTKAGLKVLKIEESQKSYRQPHGPIFAFDFQGVKNDGQEVKGTIDAPDRVTAETRLRNEFGLNQVALLGQKKIFQKTDGREIDAAEALLRQVLIQKKEEVAGKPQPRNFWRELLLDTRSFIYWLLLIYIVYYFYSALAIIYPLGLPVDLAQNTRESTLFVWLLVGLAGIFLVLEMPHLIQIWERRTTFWRAIYISSVLLLLPIGGVKGWLMILHSQQVLPEIYYRWFLLLNWPLAILITLLILSFAILHHEERFLIAE